MGLLAVKVTVPCHTLPSSLNGRAKTTSCDDCPGCLTGAGTDIEVFCITTSVWSVLESLGYPNTPLSKPLVTELETLVCAVFLIELPWFPDVEFALLVIILLLSIVLLGDVCAKELVSLLLAIKLKLATKSDMHLFQRLNIYANF